MSDEPTDLLVRPPDGLSAEQRMNRICELLSKAVVRDWAGRIVVERAAARADPAGPEFVLASSDRERILNYLALVGAAGSPQIRVALGLSKMRVYRAIRILITDGRVATQGRSRMTAYGISPTESAKAALN